MEITKYCNEAIINYSRPGHNYGFSLVNWTLLPHSHIQKCVGDTSSPNFIGNSCRRYVYSGQYLACSGRSSEFCFALFFMTSSDIPHKMMGMQKTVEGKGMTFYYLCQSISNTPGSMRSCLLGSNTLCLLLESCLQMAAYHR